MPPVAKLINIEKGGSLGQVKMVAIREHRFPFLVKVLDIIDIARVIVEFDNRSRGMLDLCMFAEGSKIGQEISVVGDVLSLSLSLSLSYTLTHTHKKDALCIIGGDLFIGSFYMNFLWIKYGPM